MKTQSGQLSREGMRYTVQAHLAAEQVQDLGRLLATLQVDATWEIIPTGEVWRSPDESRSALARGMTAIPGRTFQQQAVHTTNDSHAFAEVTLSGRLQGPLGNVETRGQSMHIRQLIAFDFRGGQFRTPLAVVFLVKDGKVLGEREYSDRLTVRRGLGLTP